MTNVLFRYILGLLLIILLTPETTLQCKNKNLNMADVKNNFQHIIFEYLVSLQLDHFEHTGYNKSSNSKPQKAKPHCRDGKEITSIYRLTCSAYHMAHYHNLEHSQKIAVLSRMTEGTLKCNCTNRKKKRRNANLHSQASTIKGIEINTNSRQKKLLKLKEKMSYLMLCWQKLFRVRK
eukprot:gi/632958380/ref/XP_007895001.1/ PREDICTED: interleukin-7-like [Callorhinchus milii]